MMPEFIPTLEDLKNTPKILDTNEYKQLFEDLNNFRENSESSEALEKLMVFWMPYFIKKYKILTNQYPLQDKKL